MNPLDQYPQIRKYLYMIQWIANGVIVVLSALFGFMYGTPEDWPTWFLAVLAVAPVLWTYLGITAQTNVTPDLPDDFGVYDIADGLNYEDAGGQPFPETPDQPLEPPA